MRALLVLWIALATAVPVAPVPVAPVPAWADGLRYPAQKDTAGNYISPCSLSWVEPYDYKVYIGARKDGSDAVPLGSPVANVNALNPLRTFSTPCPAAPGQYWWTVDERDRGLQEGNRSFPNAFMIVDASIPVVLAGILPFAGQQGQTLDVTITGTGFVNSGVAQMLTFTPAGIVPTNIVIASDTLLTATLTIPAGQAPGTSVVSLGMGFPRGDLASGFTVLQAFPAIGVGSTVFVATKTGVQLNVRPAPTLSSCAVCPTEPRGASGLVLAGPTVADGITWWQVQYPDRTGWSSGAWLQLTPPQ